MTFKQILEQFEVYLAGGKKLGLAKVTLPPVQPTGLMDWTKVGDYHFKIVRKPYLCAVVYRFSKN